MNTSCSFTISNKVPVRGHIERKSHTENVDTKLSHANVTLINELENKKTDDYINELMQPSIDAYNAKQKRKDRRKEMTYTEYNNSLKDKQQLTYEIVIQAHNHDNLGGEYYAEETTPERRAELKKEFIDTYKQMIEGLQKRFPHIHIAQAIIHFDEPNGTPHVHLIVIPIANNYKQGFQEQICLSRALACDGIERPETVKDGIANGFCKAKWQAEAHHNVLNRVLEAKGYTINAEQHGVPHTDPAFYRAYIKQATAESEKIKDKYINEAFDWAQKSQDLQEKYDTYQNALTTITKTIKANHENYKKMKTVEYDLTNPNTMIFKLFKHFNFTLNKMKSFEEQGDITNANFYEKTTSKHFEEIKDCLKDNYSIEFKENDEEYEHE